MNYNLNTKNNDSLSILGYGCMRFPLKNGKIDYEETKKLLQTAVGLGVNYFDTAYVYHNGESEEVVGRFFDESGLRKKVKIATKLPLFSIKRAGEFEELFKTQLKKLRTDYVDYYLLHSITGLSQYEKFKKMGVLDWAKAHIDDGSIKNLGFSYHGTKDDFMKILDDYDWGFVQIQYNYLDENFQAGKEGLRRANKLGIPVIIMEPLQGGNITDKLPAHVREYWQSLEPKRTLADWALRWVWNDEGVLLLLSGMSTLKQLTENCETASTAVAGGLSAAELEYFGRAKILLSSTKKIPCTACQYCVPVCPKHIDIPGCFTDYNKKFAERQNKSKDKLTQKIKRKAMPYVNHMISTGAIGESPALASSCIACKSCERHCPQGIKISDELKNVVKELEGPFFSLIKIGGRFVLK
ncbi:MAG: aldo/keto reductase [Clostridiales bacterium]|jgi:predicted aldo/keto reductase-like oxidoreductase|nr:aldo/keto reductase [Clostridiales bacterium]